MKNDVADRRLQTQARALGDPTRHPVFVFVRDAPRAVRVSEINERFPLNHNAIRQHLSKLVGADLVVEERAAPRGPGRPALLYRTAPGAAERWGGEGAFGWLVGLLMELRESGDEPFDVGRHAGVKLSETLRATDGAEAVLEVARRLGFGPRARRAESGDDTFATLSECPFLDHSWFDPAVICELHRGMITGVGSTAVTPAAVREFEPRADRADECRVTLRTQR